MSSVFVSIARGGVLFFVFLSLSLCTLAADHAGLQGKIFCGYQGWFRAEGDGSGLGWVHFGPGKKFAPGHCSFDLWPDLSEFSSEELYPSPFVFADGTPAPLFSSVHPKTVRRHFRWMREYGIDGAFVQRFLVTLRDPIVRKYLDLVLKNCTEAANTEGRSLTVMYDLSGGSPEEFRLVGEDLQRLAEGGQMREPCAQKCNGKPLVALWGLGFSDRLPALHEWNELLSVIKRSGFAVMLGVPTFWRELNRDCIADAQLHELLKMADVISPWSVSRSASPEEAGRLARNVWKKDQAWCNAASVGYMPVVFPGFSWHNLSAIRGQKAILEEIPRLGGRFLWRQGFEAKQAGAQMLYVAMFDEIDEGTAVMKCGGRIPSGKSPFVDLSDVPSDHYLWLCGELGRMLRGEISAEPEPPRRNAAAPNSALHAAP